MDPATAAWCAAFVNSALQHEGIEGTHSNLASSFLKWGVPATGKIQAGDVGVEPPGEGFTGHAGMLTGNSRIGPNGQLQYEFVSSHKKGSMGNPSGVDWRDANEFAAIRRAADKAMAHGTGGPSPASNGVPPVHSTGLNTSVLSSRVKVGIKLTYQPGGNPTLSQAQLGGPT